MKLEALDDSELIAFIALGRLIVRADLDFSESEQEVLFAHAQAVGMERWGQLMNASADSLPDRASAFAAAADVTRAEARTAILTALTDLAGSDSLVAAEQAVLDELQQVWTT